MGASRRSLRAGDMAEAPMARAEGAEGAEGVLTPRRAPAVPVFMMRDPAPRNVGHMCVEDRRRFVQIALDAARERLRAYRLVCTAAQRFYAQHCGAEQQLPKRN